jgi:transposase InsO family protein
MKNEELDRHRQEALRRFGLIAPLLEDNLPNIELIRRKAYLRSEQTVSERTLRRWVAAYRKGGFDALVPLERKDKGSCKAISPEVLALAEECRKELPRRSAGLIRDWLKREGHEVARSTLERQLRQRGLSGRQLRTEAQNGAGRRFVRLGRNSLWQGDLKYGPYLPDPKKAGKKIRSYLMVLIDDATRLVTHAEFYDNQKLPILEDSFKKAVQKCGSPKALYVDNGKIFVSTWLQLACGRLNVRHLRTRPFSPESKGKVERFNRTVEAFLSEVSLNTPQTLAELNEHFRVWLSEAYHHAPHSGLGGKTPAETFAKDETPLRFHRAEDLQDAFLWECERTVDKSGCLQLAGEVYEAGIAYIRKKVLLRYDPFDPQYVQLWRQGKKEKLLTVARPPEHNGGKHAAKNTISAPTGKSRFLEIYARESQQRCKQRLGAMRLREETADV